jgi:hypothetical protein
MKSFPENETRFIMAARRAARLAAAKSEPDLKVRALIARGKAEEVLARPEPIELRNRNLLRDRRLRIHAKAKRLAKP